MAKLQAKCDEENMNHQNFFKLATWAGELVDELELTPNEAKTCWNLLQATWPEVFQVEKVKKEWEERLNILTKIASKEEAAPHEGKIFEHFSDIGTPQM